MLASGLDPAIDPKASELFHGLDSHSVLRVLHQSTHLSQLEPSEVFDMLSKRPQLGKLKVIFRDPLIRSTLCSTHTDFLAYSERTLLY